MCTALVGVVRDDDDDEEEKAEDDDDEKDEQEDLSKVLTMRWTLGAGGLLKP